MDIFSTRQHTLLELVVSIEEQQQWAKEKSTKLGHRMGSGFAANPECVGVGALVAGVQC